MPRWTHKEIVELEEAMTPEERLHYRALVGGYEPQFIPNEGPQTDAFNCKADILGYGGAAGGGKSMLLSGTAITSHKRSLIIRQEKTTTKKFVQDIQKMRGGDRSGYSSQGSTWTMQSPDGEQRLVEFAGLENEGDEEKQQGIDYDLKGYDEVTQMRETQVRYTMGWVRTDDTTQQCRTIFCFNPPTTAEGRWVIKFFGPWLDAKHPNPAADGELRWFATIGDDPDYELPVEMEGAEFVIVEGEPVYEFDRNEYKPEEIVQPKSRTFITARVTDNPYYMESGYISQLQALPEPLRSQMLRGDFTAGIEDAEYQVIPTAWIEAAMDRWYDPEDPGMMDSMGVDAARGGNMGATMGTTGKDKMVIARRHGVWFAPVISIKGMDVNSGSLAAAQVVRYRRDNAPVHLDVAGIGVSPYDYMVDANIHVEPINNAAGSVGQDKSGLLKFCNLRAETYWMLREALDPENPVKLMLPDDAELLADLAAPTYKWTKSGILMEPKDDLKKRLKRSPDKGDAVVLANISTPRRKMVIGGYADVAGAPGQGYEDNRFNELGGQ